MTTVFCTRLYSRFIVIKSNLERKKLPRTPIFLTAVLAKETIKSTNPIQKRKKVPAS